MKKLVTLLSALICVVVLNWVVQPKFPIATYPAQSDDSSHTFSFAEDSAIYSEGEFGVKTSGFVNTTATEITAENLVEHAKKECKVWHNCVDIDVDTAARVWRVNFYTQSWLGGGQTVYMDYDGKTVLIVYGE